VTDEHETTDAEWSREETAGPPRSDGVSAGAVSLDTRHARLRGPFVLDGGGSLDEVTVAYRTWGRLDAQATNGVLVCHPLTGSADVDAWWSPLLGPGRALDPDRDFVVCSNVLGGCHGTSGPASVRGGDGRRRGGAFPAVSVRDMVRVQAALLETLGVRRLRLVVGGALGGMQALEWPLLFPARVEAIAAIAAPARQSAWAVAISVAQRQAVCADPRWQGGDYPECAPPTAGLAAARVVALCAQRGRSGLEGRRPARCGADSGDAVGGWLLDHGHAFAESFDAASYVALTRAADGHDVGRGRGGAGCALRTVGARALVVSVDTDALYPRAELEELAAALPGGRLARLSSPHGHDAFLIEGEETNALVAGFRAGGTAGRPDAGPVARAC